MTKRETGIKKVQSKIKDAEIGDERHEALLRLLDQKRDEAIGYLFDRDVEWIKERAKEAEDKARQVLSTVIKRLNKGPTDKFTELKELFEQKAVEFKNGVRSFVIPSPDEEVGYAEIKAWNRQVEVFQRVKAKRFGDNDRLEFAGFVDLEATVNIAHELYVEVLADKPLWFDPGHDYFVEHILDDASAKDSLLNRRREELSQIRLTRPTWYCEHETRVVRFDVRSILPTTGELLRDLKTLRGLDAEKPAYLGVVCWNMDEYARNMLFEEGFFVLTADTFPLNDQ